MIRNKNNNNDNDNKHNFEMMKKILANVKKMMNGRTILFDQCQS